MTYEKPVAVKLEDVVNCSEDDLVAFRKIVFDAMFSASRADRVNNIFELNERLDRCLKRGYYLGGNIFLDVNVDGSVRTIDVGAVPREYMDVGHWGFEL